MMDGSLQLLSSIFVFLLHFQVIEPGATEKTIKNVMVKDKLCIAPIKHLLIQSDFVKKCDTLTYPSAMDKLNFQDSTTDTFLCLNVYDAVYKVCHYIEKKQWTSSFNNQQEFDEMVQHFVPQESSSKDTFCKDLKEYSPMYNEIKPALSKLVDMLKQQDKCLRICFDFNDQLNPLCAILAWIRSIDKEVQKKITTAETVSKIAAAVSVVQPVGENHQPINIKSLSDSAPIIASNHLTSTVKNIDTNKNNVTNLHNSPKDNVTNTKKQEVPFKDDHDKMIDMSDTKGNESKIEENDITKAGKVDPMVSKVVTNADNNNKPKDANVQNDIKVPLNGPSTIGESGSNDNTQKDHKDKAEANLTEDEIKSSTLSEHTQDTVVNTRLNNGDSEDYNHLDQDQPHYVNGDVMEQPPDIDNKNVAVPSEQGDIIPRFRASNDEEESHFFTYFASLFLVCIAGYIGYHNKQKILAIVLEGRRTRSNRARRRPSTANYRKLDCTLEEAITSQCSANVTHVIY